MNNAEKIKKEILKLTREYSRIVHDKYRPGYDPNRKNWETGETIPYAGRVFDENEVEAAVSSTLDFWLTLGNEGESFQREFAQFMGISNCLLVNSGSSANLIAITSLTSSKLGKEERIYKGDEVITVAAGFPTTVAPILQTGCVPVFIDANPITGNINCEKLYESYSKGKTKAVMLAHALGNPFDIYTVLKFCRRYNLWLIEDNCDSLGCSYSMPKQKANELGIYENSPGLDDGPDRIIRWTGTWGDLSTQSFYPPHHLTTGEGGSVNIVRNKRLKVIAESFRDWGRDCWCPSGIDNSCKKRFEWQLGDLPEGYDHKYTYSHMGYNLKPLDIQAAIGRIQLKKLNKYIIARKENWNTLREGLSRFDAILDFALPTHATNWEKHEGYKWDNTECRTECSWFGFKIGVKPNAPFTRSELVKELDKNKIGNRMLFGGNLLRQPAFIQQMKDDEKSIRTIGEMRGSDKIMNEAFFLGTYPGLTKQMIAKEIEVITEFIRRH